jgi:hypothetical protein
VYLHCAQAELELIGDRLVGATDHDEVQRLPHLSAEPGQALANVELCALGGKGRAAALTRQQDAIGQLVVGEQFLDGVEGAVPE